MQSTGTQKEMPRTLFSNRLLLVIATSLLVSGMAPFIGPTKVLSLVEIVSGDGLSAQLFYRIRLPRVILGFLCGASLGTAGLIFQSLFHNPLASPFTFGVASGAAFGTAALIALDLHILIGGVSIGGIVGSIFCTAFVYAISKRALSAGHLLLAGVVMSFFFSSLLLLVQYVSNFTQSFQIVRWLMGGLETLDYLAISSLLPFLILGLGAAYYYRQELNLITLGEELAYSKGVEVNRVRALLFVAASLMVGATVSVVGPIGFVGIICPHICRRWFGLEQRLLIPATIAFSGSFLVVCDTVARVSLTPTELPVGLVTSLLGGPFFLWLLLRGEDSTSG